MEQGTIRIKAKFAPLAYTYLFNKPMIQIDGGTREKTKWGETTRSVDPGQHTVHIYVKGGIRTEATTTVEVAPGESTTLLYKAPFMLFGKAKLTAQPASA
jgi:hypothetical protein